MSRNRFQCQEGLSRGVFLQRFGGEHRRAEFIERAGWPQGLIFRKCRSRGPCRILTPTMQHLQAPRFPPRGHPCAIRRPRLLPEGGLGGLRERRNALRREPGQLQGTPPDLCEHNARKRPAVHRRHPTHHVIGGKHPPSHLAAFCRRFRLDLVPRLVHASTNTPPVPYGPLELVEPYG